MRVPADLGGLAFAAFFLAPRLDGVADAKNIQVPNEVGLMGFESHKMATEHFDADKANKKLFMIAQSYMPAQDIHILDNKNNPAISPWYELDENAEEINTPEWTFYCQEELRRF